MSPVQHRPECPRKGKGHILVCMGWHQTMTVTRQMGIRPCTYIYTTNRMHALPEECCRTHFRHWREFQSPPFASPASFDFSAGCTGAAVPALGAPVTDGGASSPPISAAACTEPIDTLCPAGFSGQPLYCLMTSAHADQEVNLLPPAAGTK